MGRYARYRQRSIGCQGSGLITITFHIIYTPGSFTRLGFFVHSLLRHTDCDFRLVANGCSRPERQQIHYLCGQSERLSSLVLPSAGVTTHGVALNYLQAICREDLFCFMDSDILATGSFVEDFQAALSKQVAVFSGAPVWATHAERILPNRFQIVSGVHHQSENDACLGSSYFAMYDNHALSGLMQDTGIGFEASYWSQLNQDVRLKLQQLGVRKDGYDTGRVLNLMLQSNGHRMTYQSHPFLHHIGGYSFVGNGAPASWNSIPTNTIVGSAHRFAASLRRLSRAIRSAQKLPGLSASERKMIVSRRLGRRDPVRNYFDQLLTALHTNRQAPVLPVTGVEEVDRKVEVAAAEVQKLFDSICSHGPAFAAA